MPFCGSVVSYTPCVPKYQVSHAIQSALSLQVMAERLNANQVLPPSREFPEGRFYNNTVLKKDQWVQQTYFAIIGKRRNIEKSKTLKKLGESW
jgi:hypothetical protein